MGFFTYTDNILYTDIPNLNTDTFCLSFPIQDMQRYNCNIVESGVKHHKSNPIVILFVFNGLRL
jgi:hypothetical protein